MPRIFVKNAVNFSLNFCKKWGDKRGIKFLHRVHHIHHISYKIHRIHHIYKKFTQKTQPGQTRFCIRERI